MTDESAKVSGLSHPERLIEITEALGSARTMVDSGQLIELDGLEAATDQICAEVTGLPADERERCKDGLLKLLAAFDELAGALQRQHEQIGDVLKTSGDRRRATSAYGRAPGGKT